MVCSGRATGHVCSSALELSTVRIGCWKRPSEESILSLKTGADAAWAAQRPVTVSIEQFSLQFENGGDWCLWLCDLMESVLESPL